MGKQTVIKVRRGINGFKYAACDEHGCFLQNFKKLSDVRKYWLQEIKWGHVTLVRELDELPDMTETDNNIKALEQILKAYGKDNG